MKIFGFFYDSFREAVFAAIFITFCAFSGEKNAQKTKNGSNLLARKVLTKIACKKEIIR
jgi:hypothetical protein